MAGSASSLKRGIAVRRRVLQPPTLEDGRVRLRPLRRDDLAFSLAFANDEGMRPLLRFHRPADEEKERGWLYGVITTGEPRTWAITDPATPEPRGLISLDSWDKVAAHAELGLGILRPEDRGRGLGAAAIRLVLRHAFDDMRLQRVHLRVYETNPARALYERLGFRHEGTLRRHAFKQGRFLDVHEMAILREEWSP